MKKIINFINVYMSIFASASSINGSAGQLMDHQYADMPPSVSKQYA